MAVNPSLSPRTAPGAVKLEAMELALEICDEDGHCIMNDFDTCDNCSKPKMNCRPTCPRRAIRQCWDEELLEIISARPLKYVVTSQGRQLIARGQVQREAMMSKVAA